MDDYDDIFYEVSRPRLQVVSGPATDGPPEVDVELTKWDIALTAIVALSLLVAAFFSSGLLQITCIWVALSVAIGPFSPLSHSGGDCRVGIGEPVIERQPVVTGSAPEDTPRGKVGLRKRLGASGANSRVEPAVAEIGGNAADDGKAKKGSSNDTGQTGRRSSKKGGAWTDDEIEALRKGMVKYPRGTAKRWEVIGEAIGTGRTADEVVKKAKEMSEKKPVDEQSFLSFLAQRKTATSIASEPSMREIEDEEVDRVREVQEQSEQEDGEQGTVKDADLWNDVQDMALVRAVKEFPKETSMRWDRVASAVPGKSKAQCMKRFMELKKGFREARDVAGSPGGGEQAKQLDLRKALL